MPFDPGTASYRQVQAGPLETLVVRHSDPVRVRRPDSDAGYPLAYYHKRERLPSGSWVYCEAGGRAEILWPGDASSVLFSGPSAAIIGEPTRDEALVSLQRVTYARLILTPEDRVALPGGAILRGDPVAPSGPFVLERLTGELLRLTNQSSQTVQLQYRDSLIDLSPADAVDLPLMSSTPIPEVEEESVSHDGLSVNFTGELEARTQASSQGGILLEATSDAAVDGLGVRVSLAPGDKAIFRRLAQNTSPRPTREETSQAEETPE